MKKLNLAGIFALIGPSGAQNLQRKLGVPVRGMGNTVTASAPKSRLRSGALHKLQIIDHRTKRCCVLSQDDSTSSSDPSFAEWLRDRKNARRIPHRMEECGYVAVRNPDATDGRWKMNGRRQAVYTRSELSQRERLQQVYELTGAR
jgi:hypothetical protein